MILRPESLFVDLDRPPIERLGLRVLALVLKQKGEIVVVRCNVGMILAEGLLVDLDRPSKERPRPRRTCPGPQALRRDRCNRDRNVGMILAESLLVDLDRPSIERLGLGILALGLKQVARLLSQQRRDDPCRAPFVDLDRPSIERLGLGVLALVLKRRRFVVSRATLG